ncbi:MAG TPA: choice-of-anchor D domain-containing protein [Ktedonobacteraceae bacterium]|nr:choice-of-anchor D domain-containing protein [Ktedonobacteraceae bacterium]
MSRKLTKPSIPPASPHLVGHYSGLHPEDQPYQSSQMMAQHPVVADTSERHQLQQDPEQIVLPPFEPLDEPHTDPELYRPTALIIRQPKWPLPYDASLPARMRERFSRSGIGAPRFSSMVLTVTCLLFLLASSILAFVLIGNHTSIATAAFSASPSAVRTGHALTLVGRGFKSSSLLHFSLDTNQPVYDDSNTVLTVRTDEHGAFSLQLHVPSSWSVGQHTLYASDPSQGVSISTNITVEPPSIAQPDLQVSETSLKFSAMAAGTISNQPLVLLNTGGGTVHWQASSDQPWLSAAPTNGTFSDRVRIQVAVNRGSLSPQSYSAHLVLTQQGSPTKSLQVTVTMEVSPAPAALTLTPTTLAFAGSTTQNPPTQNLVIQNSGGLPLNWTSKVTTESNASWLAISPAEGHLDAGTSATLVVSILSQQLTSGSYQGTISFAGDANALVTVNLDVQAPGNLVFSPPSLTMNILNNQPPTMRTVTLQNNGGQSLDWTASATTADGGKWLSVTPASGTLAVGGQVTVTVKVQSGLTAGAYQGTVNFSSQGQTRQLAISCAVTAPPIAMQTDALHFTAHKGVNPASQSLTMTNTGNTALNWTVKLDSGAPAFLSVSPLSGSIAPGQKIPLTVSANIVNAEVGTLTSGISIVNSNDTGVLLADQEVSVDVVISDPATPLAATPASLTFKQAASTAPGTQTLTITNTTASDIHWSLAQPTNTAQSWLALSQDNGTVGAGGSVTINISCTDAQLASGSYTTTLQLFNTDISASTPVQTFTVTLTVA